jgi:hypothetical protein
MTTTTPKKTPLMPLRLIKSLLKGSNPERSGYASTEAQQAILQKIKGQGLTNLGTGAYSVVIQHPHDKKKAIKLTMSRVDGYHKYVEWVQQVGPTLPRTARKHLPIIYKSTLIDGTRVTVLEKLTTSNRNHAKCATSYGKMTQLVTAMSEVLQLRDDQGSSNVMVRAGKTAVITDPWAH